jgi:LEA14-like dessication related protein
MACELEINGKRFASGVSNKEVEIPAYGHDLVTVHVYSSVLDVFKGVLGLKDAGKLRYRIKGKVLLDAGTLAPSTFPFLSEGELSLDNLVQ